MKNLLETLQETILFPAPNPSNYTEDSHPDYFFWLPTNHNMSGLPLRIPCMLYSPSLTAQFFTIWCHGNGVDIGSMDMTMKALSRRLQTHILIFEYPKYGLLKEMTPSPNKETINHYAECAFLYVRDSFKWPTNRIIIYGHSIGTGPACHLASTQSIGGLILQSPYISIEALVREKMSWIANWISISYWDNFKAMHQISCPVLFLHGEHDILIPCHHSKVLFNTLGDDYKNKKLVLLPDDDHNSISDPVLLIHTGAFFHEFFSAQAEPMPEIVVDPSLRRSTANNTNPSTGTIRSFVNRSMRGVTNLSNSMKSMITQSREDKSSDPSDDQV